MKYWDWIEQSQENMSKDFPNGDEGFKAICFIRSFFEHTGIEEISRNHPLHNRLSIGMIPNYFWLVQYARKLLTATQIPGFESVAKRFSNPKQYLAANAETETALKMYLGGFDVSFVKTMSQPTCDLEVKMDSEVLRIEVTSLNPSDEEMLIEALVSRVTFLGFRRGIAAGGFVSRVKSAKIFEDVLKQAEQAVSKVEVSRKVEKFNYKGVATIYFAPDDMVSQMPVDSRRAFRFNQPPRRSIEEQINKKIAEKDRQLQQYKEPGLLFLYTQMIDRQSILRLFDQSMEDIKVALASYPKLLGVVLTVPHLGIEVANAVKTEDLKKESKGNKFFIETENCSYQYESSLLWKNLHADRAFPEKIATAIENYSSNLCKLASLQKNFKGFKIFN